MYKLIIRPILFYLDPEKVHYLIVKCIKLSFKIPGIKIIFKLLFSLENPLLETEILGLKFKSPIGLAAGFDKNANIFNEFSTMGFSFIEIGTVTPKPQPGNQKPRIFRIPADKALINRMGLNNLGVNHVVEKLKHRKGNVIIGGNIGKNTTTLSENAADDYEYCFNKLYDYVDYFTINVSCPNVHNIIDLQDKESLGKICQKLVDARKEKTNYRPILVKISPDLDQKQLDDTIEVSVEKGIDGFVISNTTINRDNLSIDNELIDKIGNGGLSGSPLSDKSTKIIRYVADKTDRKFAIIGVGGIMSEKDAIEKLKAGANLLQVYTGFIYEGPGFARRLNKSILKERLKKILI